MSATPVQGRVAVALCDSLAVPGDDLDLAALCESLEQALPEVRAEVVPDLSRSAASGPALAARVGADRLVLALSVSGASAHEVQREVRRIGLDPFAVELLYLAEGSARHGSSAALELRLAAAIARLRAFAGTAPEQLRPRLLTEWTAVSRRSLLTLPPLTYEAVPSVSEESCREPERCGLCVEACPVDALATEAGRVFVDKARCTACGLCVAICPRGAFGLPGSSLAQYEAQIETLLAADEPALLFCCRKTATALQASAAGWLPVEVPCVAMVTPGWTLQALARGASAVGICPCEHDCGFSADAVGERISYVRDVLCLLGDRQAAVRVQLVSSDHEVVVPPRLAPLRGGPEPSGSLRLGEPAATAEALLELSQGGSPAPVSSLAHPASPLGRVDVREDACTLCGACAAVCPTGALRLEENAEGIALSYKAADCVACGRCTQVCPEARAQALHVERATDLDAVARGRTVLKLEALVYCRTCGRPIAPRRLLERIGELLAGEKALLRLLGERCADCRSASALPPNGPEMIREVVRLS